MKDIKEGEFIRTKDGTITKIEDIEFEIKTNMFGQILYEVFIEENRYYKVIVKHSPNITDLIEVGDYVNGELVERIDKCEDEFEITTTTEYITNLKDIISIVTKEQFDSIKYEV